MMIVHSHQSAMNYRGHNEVQHVAEFLSKKTNRPDIAQWCYRAFGPAGYQAMTDEIRWQDSIQYGKIVFSREQDLTMFILRWS